MVGALPLLGARHGGLPADVPRADGRITGEVTLSNALAARRPKFRIYGGVEPGSTPPSKPAPELKDEYANVVVYLELDGSRPLGDRPNGHPTKPSMVQRG